MRSFLYGLATGVALIGASGAGYRAGARSVAAVTPDSAFAVSRAGASLFRVNVDGRVGVGTEDPQATLHVIGAVRAHGEIQSDSGGFRYPDNSLRTLAPAVRYDSAYGSGPPFGFGPAVDATAHCAAGERAIAGGYRVVVGSPSVAEGRPAFAPDPGWTMKVGGSGSIMIYVACATGLN